MTPTSPGVRAMRLGHMQLAEDLSKQTRGRLTGLEVVAL